MTQTANQPKAPESLTDSQQAELAEVKQRFLTAISQLVEGDALPVEMATLYPNTASLPELLEQLDDLKRCLDSFRPIDPSQMKHLLGIFDTEYTYASNRIEGNTLSLRETSFVINEGLTIRNKSMQEHLEAINHRDAIAFVRDLVTNKEPLTENKEPLTERNIRLIHGIILQGIDRENAGVYRTIPVGIAGTDIVFPQPFLVPKLMEELMEYYEQNKDVLHPAQLAAQMHARLVNIHPFVDGNGRTCRLVMNMILLQHGYPVTVFEPEEENRNRYFDALNQARETPDNETFDVFVAENVKHWALKYLSMLAPNIGESSKDKGYYFFKKIAPHLTQTDN